VDKADVGLGSVANYPVATQAEAEAGASNSDYMTPLRTKQAYDNQNLGKTIKVSNSSNYGDFNGGFATLEFDTVNQDDFGIIDLNTYPTRLTIPSGVSTISVRARLYASAVWNSADYFMQLYKNGTTFTSVSSETYSTSSSSNSPTNLYTPSTILNVSPGDYFEIKGDLDTFGAGCYIEVIVLK
jgi:hypothetical protein